MTVTLPNEFIKKVTELLGKQSMTADSGACSVYGYDNSKKYFPPLMVVFPSEHGEIQELIKLCNQFNIPIFPRGRGTGTVGGCIPTRAGIVCSFERMNKIIRVNPKDRYLIAEPGVTNTEIQQAAKEYGFFWPPDPSSSNFCTLGGNLAYNSAGPRAIKYGTPRENTLGLKAITGAGESLKTGSITTKSVVGYDLTRLIIGSEGTLAIITSAILKLTPLPEGKITLMATYKTLEAAANAVSNIMAQPIIPYTLEFIDNESIKAIANYIKLDISSETMAILLIELDGAFEYLREAKKKLILFAKNDDLIAFEDCSSSEKASQVWRFRKSLSPALRNIAPKKINEDVVVPVSKLPDLITGVKNICSNYKIKNANFGHAGNGNIHINLLVNENCHDELIRSEDCLSEIFKLVMSLGGSLSGEHGTGLSKKEFLHLELDQTSINLMRQIKAQFDPNNILNPGKIP